MATTELFNLQLAHSTEDVDRINKEFYGRFNYPWPPMSFPAYPPRVANLFLNQEIGYWGHDRITDKPKILVAGCGTNQAIYVALRYPDAEVVGVDISTKSLEVCRRNADQIGIKHLTLEEKSLNDLGYKDEFDFIICTGVIHHNAEPLRPLAALSAALKRNGIMELMVYNYYHRILNVACQKAVRSFNTHSGKMDLDGELSVIKPLISNFPYKNHMGAMLQAYVNSDESAIADVFLQPVECSYTVETLEELIGGANLEYLTSCLNQFDVSTNSMNWNLKMGSNLLQKRYDALPDVKRWQIANLLLLEQSPMLWFYLQRKDSAYPRKTEAQVCNEFLEMKFSRSSFPVGSYVLNDNGAYVPGGNPLRYPLVAVHNDEIAKRILPLVDSRTRMKDIMHALKMTPTFSEINDLRIKLTSLLFPYLLAIQ